jgi:hypothetical protein
LVLELTLVQVKSEMERALIEEEVLNDLLCLLLDFSSFLTLNAGAERPC